MSDRVEIPCPGCGRSLRVRPEYFGLQIICKYCSQEFTAHPPPATPHVISWPDANGSMPESEPAEAGGYDRRLAALDGLAERCETLGRTLEAARLEWTNLRAAVGSLRREFEADPHRSRESADDDARRQVESLTSELAEARARADRVQSTLVAMGIRFADRDEVPSAVDHVQGSASASATVG